MITPQNSSDFYAPTLKSKEKGTDAFRHFAKNTLRKAGLMPRNNNPRKMPQNSQSHLIRTPETMRKSMRSSDSGSNGITTGSLDLERQQSLHIDSEEEALSSKNFFLLLTLPDLWYVAGGLVQIIIFKNTHISSLYILEIFFKH